MENNTRINCDESTVDVVKNFINDHMDYTIDVDEKLDEISIKQKEIRETLEPYMKEKLDYLKKMKFGNWRILFFIYAYNCDS